MAPGAGADDAKLPLAGIVLIVIVGFGWGINWASIKAAVTEVPPWTFRAWCLIVGATGMLMLVRIRVGRLAFPRKELGPLLLLSALNVIGYQMLVAFGLSMMEATRGAVLGNTQPLWTMMFGAMLLKETLSPDRVIALILGLAAMALLIAPEAAMLGGAPWGALLILGGALSWGLGTVLFKRFDSSLTAVELAAWQLSFACIPVTIMALLLDPAPSLDGLSGRGITALLYSAFIGVWLIQWAWYRALQLLPAVTASIGSLLIPVVGMFASAILLGESITWIEYAALALVLVSLSLLFVGHARLRALVGLD